MMVVAAAEGAAAAFFSLSSLSRLFVFLVFS